jgi:hypothetical protein
MSAGLHHFLVRIGEEQHQDGRRRHLGERDLLAQAQLHELVLQHPLRADLHRDGDARAGGHVGQVAPLQ